jgi:hypothetical protein
MPDLLTGTPQLRAGLCVRVICVMDKGSPRVPGRERDSDNFSLVGLDFVR